MSDTVISVENLSKLYRLGETTTGTLSHDLNRWWHRVRGKEDPYAKVGQTNDRTKKGASDYVWALKDLSFEVKRGEVLGVIGRNGAGKSTLLKMLSRVTVPTSGRIRMNGRIASMLEVGTGFHPELTGRENIYLNGAILGMRRPEIARKMDEIVDFSGCAAYLDTPVKRYSSGMLVRLAFSVAASLDAEILIIDEVLAVGDGEFHKKCLGKMNDVANSGRTLLFVSHNMGLISSLCQRVIVMENGTLGFDGPVSQGVLTYYSKGKSSPYEVEYEKADAPPSSTGAKLVYASVEDSAGTPIPEIGLADSFAIRMDFRLGGSRSRALIPSIRLYDTSGQCVFVSSPQASMANSPPGLYRTRCKVNGNFLNNGTFFVSLGLAFMDKGVEIAFLERDALCFNVREPIDETMFADRHGYSGPIPGVVRPRLDWDVEWTSRASGDATPVLEIVGITP